MRPHLTRAFDSERTVAVRDSSTSPEPTMGSIPEGSVLSDLGPEAVNCGIVKEHREAPILGVMRRGVFAPPSRLIVAEVA